MEGGGRGPGAREMLPHLMKTHGNAERRKATDI